MIQVSSAPLPTTLEYSALGKDELARRIEARKKALNAVILGHNYQRTDAAGSFQDAAIARSSTADQGARS